MTYAILQLERFKSLDPIKRWGRDGHFLLEVPTSKSKDRQQPILEDLTYKNTLTELEHRLDAVREDGNRIQANSIKAVEFLLTTTPDSTIQTKNESRAGSKYTQWLEQTKAFLCDEIGHRLVTVYLHENPNCPHIHGLLTPTIREEDPEAPDDQSGTRLCYGDLYGSPPSDLRDVYEDYLRETNSDFSVPSGSRPLNKIFDGDHVDTIKTKETLRRELNEARDLLDDPEKLAEQLLDRSTLERIRALADDPLEFVREAVDHHLKSEDPDRQVLPEISQEVPEEHLEATRKQCGEPWQSYYNPETDTSYHYMGDSWRKTEETSFGELKPFEVVNGEIRKKVFGQDPGDLTPGQRQSMPQPNEDTD